MLFQREKISAQLNKNYAQLKNCKDPIGDDLLFPDVTKAIRDAKSMAQIGKQLHGNRPKNGQRQYHNNKRKKGFKPHQKHKQQKK